MFYDADLAIDFVKNLQNQNLDDDSGTGHIVSNGRSCDPGLARPYMLPGVGPCVTLNTGKIKTRKGADGNLICNEEGEPTEFEVYKRYTVNELQNKWGVPVPVANATLLLRKDEWKNLDDRVAKIARKRLAAWTDLMAMDQKSGFDAMGTKILEHETVSDPGEAIVDMDGISEVRADRPKFQLEGLPLPITHSGFFYTQRDLASSRRKGESLSTLSAEAASRRVAEKIEKTTIGIETGLTFGVTADYNRAPTVFGYKNFPARSTLTNMTVPDGTNGPTVLSDWLTCVQTMYNSNRFGPYIVYVSNDWDQHLDNLFSTTEPSAGTLRSRLLEIGQIQSIKRLDFFTDTFSTIFIDTGGDTVARAVNGMGLTTLQSESRMGMQLNFKVMAIQVPQLFADQDGNCGIGHFTTA